MLDLKTELESALSAMSQGNSPILTSSRNKQVDTPADSPPDNSQLSLTPTFKYVPGQSSSNSLLHNMAGLQTTTNNNLALINNNIMHLKGVMEKLCTLMEVQNNMLGNMQSSLTQLTLSSSNPTTPSTSKVSKGSAQDYGFKSPIDVAADLLIRLLKQVEAEAKSRSINYRSAKPFDRLYASSAIRIVCKNKFADKFSNLSSGIIELPDNKSVATVRIASRIGEIGGISPVMTNESIGQLFEDTECRTFMSGFEEILERLKVISITLPFYEADMINALYHPYFTSDGKIHCKWNLLAARQENERERKVSALGGVKKREILGKMLTTGIDFKAAIKAAESMQ